MAVDPGFSLLAPRAAPPSGKSAGQSAAAEDSGPNRAKDDGSSGETDFAGYLTLFIQAALLGNPAIKPQAAAGNGVETAAAATDGAKGSQIGDIKPAELAGVLAGRPGGVSTALQTLTVPANSSGKKEGAVQSFPAGAFAANQVQDGSSASVGNGNQTVPGRATSVSGDANGKVDVTTLGKTAEPIKDPAFLPVGQGEGLFNRNAATGDTSSLLPEAQLPKSSDETAKKATVALSDSATANVNEMGPVGAKPVEAGFDRNSVGIGEGLSQSSLQSFASKLPAREGLESAIQATNSDLLPAGASGSAEASALSREKDNESSPSRVRPAAQGNPEPGAATARVANPSNAGGLQPPTNSRSAPSVADQLAREILARAEVTQKEGRTDFQIRLEPPELGTVRIHLVAVDQTVSARVVASDEAARQAIEQQMHVLRQSLAEAGVTLKSFHVAGSGSGWQQGQKQERTYQPMPPYDSLHFVTPKSVGSSEPATVTTAGHIDVVA